MVKTGEKKNDVYNVLQIGFNVNEDFLGRFLITGGSGLPTTGGYEGPRYASLDKIYKMCKRICSRQDQAVSE